MNRRSFLKQMAAYSAGAVATAPLFEISAGALAEDAPASGTAPLVVVGKGKDYAAVLAKVIAKVGGMSDFVKPNDKVVVKPNIGWDRTVEQGANTHPEVVKAIVKLALDAGAKQVKVFDRSCNDARRCYTNSGILPAVQSLNDPRATCPFVEDRQFIPIKIEQGKSMTEWNLHRDALECDCYINVPVAKHHGLSKLTLGLKNTMGVCGGSRGKIHQEIGQKLADLCTVIRPKLTIIDATRIMLRGGPVGGKVEDVKWIHTIIASTDPVAADAYATTLFGMEPKDLASTVAAHKMGLGEMDLNKMKIVQV